LGAVAVVLINCFFGLITALLRYSFSSDLSSYSSLIPPISLHVIWTKRSGLRLGSEPDRRLDFYPLAAGLALLAAYWWATRAGWRPAIADYLALPTVSLLSFLLGGCFLFLGSATMRAVTLPVFAVPLPTQVNEAISQFLQHASADVACAMFHVSDAPILPDGVDLHLPGFSFSSSDSSAFTSARR